MEPKQGLCQEQINVTVTLGSMELPIHALIVWPKPIAKLAIIGQRIVSGVKDSDNAKNGELTLVVPLPQLVLVMFTIVALNASLILDAFGAVLIVLA